MSDLQDYYKGEQMQPADPTVEAAKKRAAPFLVGTMEVVEDDPGEIVPMSYVVLTENDPFYVGPHHLIQMAHANRIPGRVIARELIVLEPFVAESLTRYAERLVTSCMQYHVQFFPDQPKPFVFWEPFLRRVRVRHRRTIEID